GEVKDGKFLLKEATMDAPSMGVVATGEVDLLSGTEDLIVLVSPFRTVDAVVRNIPVVGYILGGALVTIPVAVKGDVRNPTVTPMDPRAIGRELLGIVERTLKAPIRILSPSPPTRQ
ncbi:MAG: AsmA-like C-terminal domain-containing protein, partial [Deltaproteobacteria bacterium]|nr:AsmA-like C-terminal domain-containing protein [Deltaproteobacteria bacterium]